MALRKQLGEITHPSGKKANPTKKDIAVLAAHQEREDKKLAEREKAMREERERMLATHTEKIWVWRPGLGGYPAHWEQVRATPEQARAYLATEQGQASVARIPHQDDIPLFD